ncbi:MAG: helix-turn-helix transcriptional regulator, partial [Clostridia bacterium]|nr:helix-turn-helix transcriptional regulator [Clostridia bacterium]
MNIYLGENIKKLRLAKELTQENLAEFLGVTSQSVSNWERGESYPDITTLPSIALFFDVSVDELLGVGKAVNEMKISKYVELYDTMELKDQPEILNKYKKAVKKFPGEFRILVRYMELLHEVEIRLLTADEIAAGNYK